MLSAWCARSPVRLECFPVQRETSPDNELGGMKALRLVCLYWTNVGCFFAFGAGAAVKRHALVFREAFETACLDVLKVREQIAAAVIRCNKAEALGIVEPLNRACLSTHCISY